MEVVVNRRKIRDTVGQIVAGGNKAAREEARSHFGKTLAGTRRVTAGGFGLVPVGNAVPVVCK